MQSESGTIAPKLDMDLEKKDDGIHPPPTANEPALTITQDRMSMMMPDNTQEENLNDVKVGTAVPDFILSCVDGQEHKLSDFRGTKVMLCFYRFSHCPMCAYTISKLVGNYKLLAWASKLKVITVFRTDIDFLKRGLNDEDAPIPRLSEYDCYPFLALADPDGSVGSKYHIKSKGFISHGVDFYNDYSTLVGAHKSCGNTFPSLTAMKEQFKYLASPFILPSEFLIDEKGILVDVLQAKNNIESMTMDRVAKFLLTGAEIIAKRKPEREFELEDEHSMPETDDNMELDGIHSKPNAKKRPMRRIPTSD